MSRPGKNAQRIDPRRPLPNPQHEALATLLSSLDSEGHPLHKGDAYLAAGYMADRVKDRANAARNCAQMLKSLHNGVQARADFLIDQVARSVVATRTGAVSRQMLKMEDRIEEYHQKQDAIFDLATQMRPVLDRNGDQLIDRNDKSDPDNPYGRPIYEAANLSVALKITQDHGIDAGQLVKQTRTGKLGGDFAGLDDDELDARLNAMLAERGRMVVPLEKEVGDVNAEPIEAEVVGSRESNGSLH
ncbi:MAG: hypothetical protein V3V08_23350 [Nannocystaceae bacterium]